MSLALDAKTNAEAAALAAAADDQPPPLEPPFPYSRVSIDPFFFGLDAEPKASGSRER